MSVSSSSKRPPSRGENVERVGAVDRGDDLMAGVGERARRQGAERLLVLGDQNAGHDVILLDHADERQLPERVRDVHAVADDEQVGTDEADEVGVERHRALARLLQQHAGEHAPCAARGEQVLRVGERAAGFEDVVDQQHVAPAHVALDVMQDPDRAGRDRALAIARQRDELDLGRKARVMQRADQVGGEDEAALEHRDHQHAVERRRLDLLRQCLIARRDRLRVEQRPDPDVT